MNYSDRRAQVLRRVGLLISALTLVADLQPAHGASLEKLTCVLGGTGTRHAIPEQR